MLAIPQTLLEDRRRRRSLTLRIGSRKALGFGLLGLAVFIALLWGVRLAGQPEIPEGVSPQRAALVEALGSVRPFDGRLVGFAYSPVKPLQKDWKTEEVAAAIRAIDDEAELRTCSQALADVGVVELLHGRFDNAVGALVRAARRAPKDAHIASDLAAAYLARGDAKQRPYDLILSLSVALRAVAADPSLPEAQFNFALGLEKFFLWAQARRQWEAFIKAFPSEQDWVEEVKIRLISLDGASGADWDLQRQLLERVALAGNDAAVRQIVANYPQQARKYAEETLLPAWGDAWLEGRKREADTKLRVARAIGESLVSHSGDSMTKEAIFAISNAPPSRLASLAEGYKVFGSGVALDEKQEPNNALPEFLRASTLLSEGGSPFRAWAEVDAAICEYYLFDYKSALQRLARIENNLAEKHLSLRARLLWIKGLIKVRHSDLSGALSSYRASLEVYDRTGEAENVAALNFLVAECLRYQGADGLAWRHRYEALRTSRRLGASVRFHNTLFDSAEATLRLEYPRVALLFQGEMVDSPWALSKPIYMAEARLRRSITYHRLAQDDLALSDLDEAARLIPLIQDESRRLPLEADFGLARSHLTREDNPWKSAEYLRSPIEFHGSKGTRVRIPSLLYSRSKAYQAAGHHDLQEKDLAVGIQASEAIRYNLLDQHLKISYSELAQPLFDDMIDLLLRRGRTEDAFYYLERSRARTSQDGCGLGDEVCKGVQEVRDGLPSSVTLVEYSVLADRTLAWVLSRSGAKFIEIDVGEERLAKEVAEFRSLLLSSSGAGKVPDAGKALYNLLVREAISDVESSQSLVIVPDKSLYDLPFAALVNPQGRFLVEEREIVVSPSATMFVRSLSRGSNPVSGQQGGILIVSDPNLNRELGPELPRLVGAVSEARDILKLYRDGFVLSGDQARVGEFFKRVGSFDVIHLGVHALLNDEYPLLSSFVFAPENQHDSGLLLAHQVYRLRLPRTRLVVLAACDSLGGRLGHREGMMSLVRPFLASGVSSVVGSLWNVEDERHRNLFLDLHRQVSSGQSPAAALRYAQVQEIISGRKARKLTLGWARFQVVGEGL